VVYADLPYDIYWTRSQIYGNIFATLNSKAHLQNMQMKGMAPIPMHIKQLFCSGLLYRNCCSLHICIGPGDASSFPDSFIGGEWVVQHPPWPMSATNLSFEQTKFDCCGRKIDCWGQIFVFKESSQLSINGHFFRDVLLSFEAKSAPVLSPKVLWEAFETEHLYWLLQLRSLTCCWVASFW
jgi:hypothetical protein